MSQNLDPEGLVAMDSGGSGFQGFSICPNYYRLLGQRPLWPRACVPHYTIPFLPHGLPWSGAVQQERTLKNIIFAYFSQ